MSYQVNDAMYKKLGDLGFVGTLQDRISAHLASLGHNGTIADKLSKEGGLRAYMNGVEVSVPIPALDPGVYVGGGTLDYWAAARNKSTLSVFEDGVNASLDSTSPCGPALRLEGLTDGVNYHIRFRFEQDTGAGYSSVRFTNSNGLYTGEISVVSNPDIEEFDVTLPAIGSVMYLGALRINHPAGAFIKISEVSVVEA